MAFRHEARRGHTHTAASGDVTVALDDLSDVTITGVASNDLIQYNGSGWVNIPASTVIGTVDHGALSGLSDDDHPQYGHLSQDETVVGHWTLEDFVTISGGVPHIRWYATEDATDAKSWFLGATDDNKMIWEVRSDDGLTSTPFMAITRSTTTPTRIDFTTLTEINLDPGMAISWDDIDATGYENLVMESSTSSATTKDYYLSHSFTDSTTTSTTYVDVTNGVSISQAGMVNGDTYMIMHSALIGNDGTSVDINGYNLLASGAGLNGAEMLYESPSFSGTSVGVEYGYVGTFVANTAGAAIKAQHKVAAAGGTAFETGHQTFVINLTTDCPNYQASVSTATTSITGTGWTSTPAAVTLAAGDWIIFTACRFDNWNATSQLQAGLNYESADHRLMASVDEDLGDQINCHAVHYLDGYAGGTVTLRGTSDHAVTGGSIDYACIVAIPLTDFLEAYAAQDINDTATTLASAGVEEVADTLSIASLTNTTTTALTLAWLTHEFDGTTEHVAVEVQENVNSGGAATTGWDNDQGGKKTTNATGFTGRVAIRNSIGSFTAADAIDVTAVAKAVTAQDYRYPGVAYLDLRTSGVTTNTFYAGNDSNPTVIRGTSTNITSASVDIDGTLNVDSTLDVTGAATLSSTLDVTGLITGTDIMLNQAASPSIGIIQNDATADNQRWFIGAITESLQFRTVNDANTVVYRWMQVDRTGTSVDQILLNAPVRFVNTDGGVDYLQIDADGTDVNITASSVVDLNMLGDGQRLLLPSTTDVSLASTTHPFQIGTDASTNLRIDMNEIMAANAGATSPIHMQASGGDITMSVSDATAGAVLDLYGVTLKIRDTVAGTDLAAFSHDGTDFNTAFTTTTDWNITGITAIQAGTVDADFDAITATSYGGITEANLLDRTAAETVSGFYVFAGNGLRLDGTSPRLQWVENDAAVNNTLWDALVSAEQFSLRVLNDAGTAATAWLRVDRTLNVVDNIDLLGPVRVRTGDSLTLFDSTNTDSAAFSHDGTDLNTDFATTTDWNINDGVVFKVWDTTNTDYISLRHDGTDANINHSGTLDCNFQFGGVTKFELRSGGTEAVLHDGWSLKVQDSTDADYIALSHDGTDANIAFVGTTDLNILNGVLVKVFDSAGTDFIQLRDTGSNAQFTTNNNNIQVSVAGGSGRLDLINGTELRLTAGGTFKMQEVAAAVADTAGYGQLWVKNTTPCQLWFTDDAGTDTQIV